jgi:hypothetical protein
MPRPPSCHTGACAAAISALCDGVDAGEGRLADCVGGAMQEADDDGNEDDGDKEEAGSGGAGKGRRRLLSDGRVDEEDGDDESKIRGRDGDGGGGSKEKGGKEDGKKEKAEEVDEAKWLEAAKAVSDECREEVMKFRIDRNSNINLNIPLGARR